MRVVPYFRYIATLTPLASQGLFYCPTCRKTHDLPTGGVPALQTNFVFNKMLEKLKVRKIQSSFEAFILFEEKLSCKATRKRKDRFFLMKRSTLTGCMCINSHQMSLPGGGPSSEQVWIGLQWWPPDVISRGSLYGEVPCLEGARARGSLYSEVQCTLGNGHIGPARMNRQTRLKTLHSCNSVGGQ